MPTQNKKTTDVEAKKEKEPEMVSREEYDKVVAENKRLINAFNKLMSEYNQLHLNALLRDE